MTGAFIALIVICSVFFGISLLTATIITGVMVATGRFTLPHSPERKIKMAEADLRVSELRRERIIKEEQIEMMMDQRMNRAIEEAKE